MPIFLVDIPLPRRYFADYRPWMSSIQVLAPTYPFPLVTNKSRRLNEFFLTVKDSVTKLTKKQNKESYNKLIH